MEFRKYSRMRYFFTGDVDYLRCVIIFILIFQENDKNLIYNEENILLIESRPLITFKNKEIFVAIVENI